MFWFIYMYKQTQKQTHHGMNTTYHITLIKLYLQVQILMLQIYFMCQLYFHDAYILSDNLL